MPQCKRGSLANAGLCALLLSVSAHAQPAGSDEMDHALIPKDKQQGMAMAQQYDTAWHMYQALKADAGGGTPLTPDTMPDWTGLWTRVGPPYFDPDQKPNEFTTAHLTPIARAELEERRQLSKLGVEYDPISDCSPPGFPRWLAIPFLREFIVTPKETLLFSETVNNLRRIYTDGRGHIPAEDAYPLWYGDSIGFWKDGTLVIHTSQIRANIFHRFDPRHSDQIETVEVWHKADDETVLADVWAYDPVALEEPWYVRQTYKKVPSRNGELRIRYWNCVENQNNTIVKENGTSNFEDFTFTDEDDQKGPN
jgi:hypothetical protein